MRYDGNDNLLALDVIKRWYKQQRLVVVCPELAGGLLIPRAPAEIQYGREQQIKVVTNVGDDVTRAFERGANEALRLCQLNDVRYALLKESSPSCGSSTIYDGSFSRQKIIGQGVTTRLLTAHGIKVYSEKTISALLAELGTE